MKFAARSTLAGLLFYGFTICGFSQTTQKAAGPATGKIQGSGSARQYTGTSSTSCADKLSVTGFSVTPSNPLPGQSVTAKMTIKNLCSSGAVNVPWKIFVGGSQIGSGTRSDVAAGSSFDVTANWSAASGQHLFDGAADPDKTLGETAANHGNNYAKSVTVNVPKLVRQLLKWSSAAQAGAQFPIQPLVIPLVSCAPLGQFEPLPGNFPDFLQYSIVYSINCTELTQPYTNTQIDFEAFKSFRLKNGWKIRQVEESRKINMGTVTHTWLVKPSVGGDDPYMKAKLYFNVVYTNPPTKAVIPAKLLLGVKVTIEGPEGKSPY